MNCPARKTQMVTNNEEAVTNWGFIDAGHGLWEKQAEHGNIYYGQFLSFSGRHLY